MKIKVLGAAGGEAPECNLTGFVIDREILLDAGTVGAKLTMDEQRAIRHVLITHAHLDHIHALPFLLDNLIGRIDQPVTVYCHPDVLHAMHVHIFNNIIWPDFTGLPTAENPVLTLQAVEPGKSFTINHYQIEPVAVDHSFAALAYVITDHSGSVIFSGDTAPVDTLWQKAKSLEHIHAIFLECSFSERFRDMAKMTHHLCTADLSAELAKMGGAKDIPVYLYHLKPDYIPDINAEIQGVSSQQIKIALSGDEYQF